MNEASLLSDVEERLNLLLERLLQDKIIKNTMAKNLGTYDPLTKTLISGNYKITKALLHQGVNLFIQKEKETYGPDELARRHASAEESLRCLLAFLETPAKDRE